MDERSFKNSGLRLGRIYGVELWIHWALLLWFGYVFYLEWIDATEATRWDSILRTVVWGLATWGTIIIHELGHCYAAHRQGGGADAIVLWPLGGLAYCDAPHLPRNQFWVAIGGPLAQVIPTALAGAAILALHLDVGMFPRANESYLAVALGSFFWWNVVCLVFNLIPLYPLDGGRVFQALLWGKLRNFGRASLITIWASRVTALTGIFLGLFVLDQRFSWLTVGILIWALYGAERLRMRLLSGEEEDYVFGYDFSRGYTSLERTATRERPKSKQRASIIERFKTRSRARAELRETEIRRQVDVLLDKISKEGMASLSHAERKFLEQASKKFHRRNS
jgi:Zn-dependent protease